MRAPSFFYLSLQGGGRSAQPTGWGSIDGAHDPTPPLASLASTLPFQSRDKMAGDAA
jgi:hypothetical protein